MHQKYLDEAYKEAVLAFDCHEVPVGCVILYNDNIVSRSHNLTNQLHSSLAHAEINALQKMGDPSRYVNKLSFYITCEPCVMCLGILERLQCKVYFGCKNAIFGGTSILNQKKDFLINLNDKKCYEILQKFYERENINAPENIRKKK